MGSRFRTYEHYNEKYELYCHTVQTQWNYTGHHPYKGDTLTEPRRIYIHYYYNIDKVAEDEKSFDRKLIGMRQELESGRRVPEHESQYKKYFEVRTIPIRARVIVNEKTVAKAKRYYGYFVLMTNETINAITVLELYRPKEVVEKAFGNLKERLHMRRHWFLPS